MLISSNRWKSVSPLNVQLDGAHIEQVSTYKSLGVMVNQSLSWSDHIDLMSSRASKGLSLLQRIAWFLPRHVLCCFYKGYILPLMTYGDTVWGSCTQAEGDWLERLQNCAARIILGRRRDASATAMRRELGWPSLASKRALAESGMVHWCVTGCAPQYLASLFKVRVSIYTIQGQQQLEAYMSPRSGLNLGGSSLLFGGVDSGMPCHLPWDQLRILHHLWLLRDQIC